MPLLRDLPEVLIRAHAESAWHKLGDNLNRLLSLTDRDIEVLLTLLYRLNECFFLPRKAHLLDPDFVDQILASSALPEMFTFPRDAEQATAILKCLRGFAVENDPTVVLLSPGNFLQAFAGAFREYFQASFKRYPCPLHLRLFEELERFDCVVSFNYDLIADYTLYSAGRLTPFSFEGLGFAEIVLPLEKAESPDLRGSSSSLRPPDIRDRLHGIKFLKVHGSFNWFCRLEETWPPPDDWTYVVGQSPRLRQISHGGPAVRYCLGDPNLTLDWTNWTLAPLILPFLTKDFIYCANPMFARHMTAFQQELAAADEIFLVGKSFQNSDHELNGMIRWATYGKKCRTLHIVDPNPDAEFEHFHCSLF